MSGTPMPTDQPERSYFDQPVRAEIVFSRDPVGRTYVSRQYVPYMQLLANAFNEGTVSGLMCKDTVNVAWDGKLYDCDFNAAIGIGSRSLTHEDLDIWSIGECYQPGFHMEAKRLDIRHHI